MEKKNRQLQTIDEFYREFLSYRPESIGVWFGAGFLVFLYGIYMWVPFAYHTEPLVDALMLFFGLAAPYLYLMPYRVYSEAGTGGNVPGSRSILEKLRYLPVDFGSIRIYRIKKLARFCGWTGSVYAAGQLFFSLLLVRELTWQAAGFALVAGIIWPFAGNSDIIRIILEKRR